MYKIVWKEYGQPFASYPCNSWKARLECEALSKKRFTFHVFKCEGQKWVEVSKV